MATPAPTAEQREKSRRISVPMHQVRGIPWKWQQARACPAMRSAFTRLLAAASGTGKVD